MHVYIKRNSFGTRGRVFVYVCVQAGGGGASVGMHFSATGVIAVSSPLYMHRLFDHPQPDKRMILDNVSNLVSAINKSLSWYSTYAHILCRF